MRFVLGAILLAASSMAMADELAEAHAALLKKSYPEALASYGKLAAAGNAEAQLRLGEMYWYGKGVALDRAKGDALFAQAAAGGNKDATAAVKLSERRSARMADITAWITTYDGAELTTGKFNCPSPAIPEVSKRNEEIARITADFSAWQDCQRVFAANMADVVPIGKRIPAEVVELMSAEEVLQAKRHLSTVYRGVMGKAAAEATAVLARHDNWEKATIAYVNEENQRLAERSKQAKIDLENEVRANQNGKSAERGNLPTYRDK